MNNNLTNTTECKVASGAMGEKLRLALGLWEEIANFKQNKQFKNAPQKDFHEYSQECLEVVRVSIVAAIQSTQTLYKLLYAEETIALALNFVDSNKEAAKETNLALTEEIDRLQKENKRLRSKIKEKNPTVKSMKHVSEMVVENITTNQGTEEEPVENEAEEEITL